MPDILDVVEEVATLHHFNTPTNNLNNEMDDAEMETNITAEENANTNDTNHQLGDEGIQTHT